MKSTNLLERLQRPKDLVISIKKINGFYSQWRTRSAKTNRAFIFYVSGHNSRLTPTDQIHRGLKDLICQKFISCMGTVIATSNSTGIGFDLLHNPIMHFVVVIRQIFVGNLRIVDVILSPPPPRFSVRIRFIIIFFRLRHSEPVDYPHKHCNKVSSRQSLVGPELRLSGRRPQDIVDE